MIIIIRIKKRCDVCNRINHTTAQHIAGHKSQSNAKEKGKDFHSYQYLYTMLSNSASSENICLKQVRVTTENDVNFKNVIDVQALYDTGASHNFISEAILIRLNIDINKLTKKIFAY